MYSFPPRITANKHVYWLSGFSLVSVALISILVFIGISGFQMARTHAPLADAVMEMKYELALFRQSFDQYLRDYQGAPEAVELLPVETVWQYLDQSEWYASAMLHGGENAHGKFIPLKNGLLRQEAKKAITAFDDLRQISQQRLNEISQGSASEQLELESHVAYDFLLQHAQSVEAAIKIAMKEDVQKYLVLIAFASALMLIILFGLCLFFYKEISNHKSYLAQMITNKQKLSLVLDATNNGVWWDWNLDNGEVTFSDNWRLTIGASEDEFSSYIGFLEQSVHPNDFLQVRVALHKHLHGNSPQYVCEYRLCKENGEVCWYSGRGKVVERDSSGNPLRMIGSDTDISIRKESEISFQNLAATYSGATGEDFYTDAAKYLAEIFAVDITIIGKLSDNGRQVNVLGGYENGHTMDLPFEYILAGSPCENVIGQKYCSYSSGVKEKFPDSVLLQQMSIEAFIGMPLFDSEGFPVGVIAIMHGEPIKEYSETRSILEIISSRIETEIERRKTESSVKILSAAIEAAGESMLVTGSDGIIKYVNPAFTELTGFSFEEAIGVSPRALLKHEYDAPHFSDFVEIVACGNVWKGKVTGSKKDGDPIAALMTVASVKDTEDRVTHYIGSYTDTSELESVQKQFYQAQKMEAIGVLAAGIAHDFNNLLAGITGNLYLAKRMQENPDQLKKLENAERLSFRAAALVEQLLTFSKRNVVAMKSLPLSSFIEKTLKLLRAMVPRNIEIHLDMDASGMQIRGDVTQIHQVLMNLVNNACDALEGTDNPAITIRLEGLQAAEVPKQGHHDLGARKFAHLSIADNGVGISDINKEHLFEPFFTTKEIGKGTGLGLAMVYGVIEAHNGFIEAESVLGKGTTFHIYLPQINNNKELFASDFDVDKVTGNGETILIVDDEKMILQTNREVLESMGYQVIEAANGQEAVDAYSAHQNEISLVIIDSVMPKLSGIKAVERIREINPDIKVIFTTEDNVEAMLPGERPAHGMVTLAKPFAIEDLSRAIRNNLAS